MIQSWGMHTLHKEGCVTMCNLGCIPGDKDQSNFDLSKKQALWPQTSHLWI